MLKKLENLNYAVKLGNDMGYSLVGVAGSSIYEKNDTLTLALIWQMMRSYTVKVMTEIGGGKPIRDQQILDWVNSKLSTPISSFKDKRISTSMPIYEVLNSLQPNTIDYSIVDSNPKDDTDKYSNARYAVSMARKMGAVVYTLPEDIVESNQKMTMCVFACLMAFEATQSN